MTMPETMNAEYLDELLRQCANVTPLTRLAVVEQHKVFSWLLDGGWITLTGKALQRERPHPHPTGRNPDGTPIYAAGADFRTHETVTMKAPS